MIWFLEINKCNVTNEYVNVLQSPRQSLLSRSTFRRWWENMFLWTILYYIKWVTKKFIDHALKILSLVLNYKWKWKSTFTSWLKVFMEFNCMAIINLNDWMFGILHTLWHFPLHIKCFIKIFLIEFTLTSSSLLNKILYYFYLKLVTYIGKIWTFATVLLCISISPIKYILYHSSSFANHDHNMEFNLFYQIQLYTNVLSFKAMLIILMTHCRQ